MTNQKPELDWTSFKQSHTNVPTWVNMLDRWGSRRNLAIAILEGTIDAREEDYILDRLLSRELTVEMMKVIYQDLRGRR